MITYRNNLDMTPGGIPPVIHLNQYDDDFQLVFDLYTSAGQFTIQTGTTAEIRGTKGDNNGYTATASITGNTVTVTGHKQMTAVAGRNVFELVLTKSNKVLSTVNFILDVERAAMDADTIQSETVLKELNAIIAGATTATEAATAAAASAAAAAESARTLTIDNTLTQSGQAADAKKTGDEISDLKSDLVEKGLSEDAKIALLDCFAHVAWIDEHGQDYYDELEDALYPDTGLVSITAVFTQGSAVIYPTTPLSDLKAYLVVTGYYGDTTTRVITNYSLSGTLAVGTSTITVTFEGKTTTFTVTVSEYWTYEWEYTDGLPDSNGMVLSQIGSNNTITLTNNGLRVKVEDASEKRVQYRYTSLPTDIAYTTGVFELEFKVSSFGSYNVAPYGNGVRMYAGMGERNNSTAYCLECTFNSGGVLYLDPNVTNWATLSGSSAFVVNTDYKVRIEHTLTQAIVYVNDVLAGTVNVANMKERMANPSFLVNRCSDVLIKAFRFSVNV